MVSGQWEEGKGMTFHFPFAVSCKGTLAAT